MHILFLIVIVPLLLLFAGVALGALILLASLALEFPGVLLAGLALGWMVQTFSSGRRHKCVPCTQP